MSRISLLPGKDNIDSRKVVKLAKNSYRLQWSIRFEDGHDEKHTTKGKSVAEVRRRAHETADKLRISNGVKTTWSGTDYISDYIMQVTIPGVDDDPKLKERSRDAYKLRLRHLAEALKGYPISAAARPSALERAFNSIAMQHGTSTARYVRKVANRVMKRLVFEQVIAHNPLTDADITIAEQVRKSETVDEFITLTPEEYGRAYAYLLAADPNDPAYTKPKAGPITQKERAKLRATILDICLLQAGTGLRIHEVRYLRPEDVTIKDGKVELDIRPVDNKTHKGRRIGFLKAESEQRFIKRYRSLPKSAAYVFHTPNNPRTLYDLSNCSHDMCKFLHEELAVQCDIPNLAKKGQGSHIWRRTLNTFLKEEGVSAEDRANYLGHTPEVNEQYYAGAVNITPSIKAAFDSYVLK